MQESKKTIKRYVFLVYGGIAVLILDFITVLIIMDGFVLDYYLKIIFWPITIYLHNSSVGHEFWDMYDLYSLVILNILGILSYPLWPKTWTKCISVIALFFWWGIGSVTVFPV